MPRFSVRRFHRSGAAGIRIAVAVSVAAGLAGCRESRVRAYEVPTETVRAPAPPAASPATPVPMGAAAGEVPRWQLPEGWSETPGSGMRFATLAIGGGERPLEVRVTPLTLAARDLLDNVNRWRQQIGLEPVTASEVGSMVTSVDAGGRPIDFVSMTGPAAADGPARQILAGILPGLDQVWFFLVFDEATRVAPHAAAFESFLKTVRLEGHSHPVGEPAAPPAGDPSASVAGGSPGGAGGMMWTLPRGWTVDPTPRDMRVATIRLAGGAGEVAITRFGGAGGDLLANINRWRNQLGLAPVADAGDQPSEALLLGGQPARLFDLSDAGEGATRKRTMVVGLTQSGMSWFIKMTGPHQILAGEEPAFRQFLASVRMAGDTP